MIISIDGPSGAGKSTLGKMLAEKLGLLYLDTGAMYRAAALAVVESGVSPNDHEEVLNTVNKIQISLSGDTSDYRVFLNQKDVTDEIRRPDISEAASVVSTIPEVRRRMVALQQEIGRSVKNGCVLEGRDIGTVVFPGADLKFFLTAKPEARARRRFEEEKSKGRNASYEEILAEINKRDQRDVSREDSPLTIPENAFVIDTSELSLEEVLEIMLAKVYELRQQPKSAKS
jgi:cytidylate kinase